MVLIEIRKEIRKKGQNNFRNKHWIIRNSSKVLHMIEMRKTKENWSPIEKMTFFSKDKQGLHVYINVYTHTHT